MQDSRELHRKIEILRQPGLKKWRLRDCFAKNLTLRDTRITQKMRLGDAYNSTEFLRDPLFLVRPYHPYYDKL